MLDFSSVLDLHTSKDCREFVRTQKI